MTQDALVEIEYGSEASSSVLNGNFEYLDDKIGTTAETIESSIDSLTSQVTTIGTTVGNGGVVPAGAVFNFAGGTVPAGYLLCDGSAVSRSTYASLFSVIGVTYGSGDGSTTFNLPLLTDGRFVKGCSASELGTASNGSSTTGTASGTANAVDNHQHRVFVGTENPAFVWADPAGGHEHSCSVSYTDTTEPKQLYLLPCIKY